MKDVMTSIKCCEFVILISFDQIKRDILPQYRLDHVYLWT